MSMSVEQFLSLSDTEQLQTIKDLNDIGQEEIIIDVLTVSYTHLDVYKRQPLCYSY